MVSFRWEFHALISFELSWHLSKKLAVRNTVKPYNGACPKAILTKLENLTFE